MKHRWVSMLLSLALVGVVAGPARAGYESGVLVVNGQATLGRSIGGGSIPQDGVCVPTGKGLHAPGFSGPFKNRDKSGLFQVNKELYYRLSSQVSGYFGDSNDPLNSGFYSGTLNICGIVTPGPLGIGAACGWSTGHAGKGKLRVVNGLTTQTRIYDVQDVAWPPAVGGILVLYGHMTRVSADKQTKYNAKAPFVAAALVRASPNDCTLQKPAPSSGGASVAPTVATIWYGSLGKPAGGKPRETKPTK